MQVTWFQDIQASFTRCKFISKLTYINRTIRKMFSLSFLSFSNWQHSFGFCLMFLFNSFLNYVRTQSNPVILLKNSLFFCRAALNSLKAALATSLKKSAGISFLASFLAADWSWFRFEKMLDWFSMLLNSDCIRLKSNAFSSFHVFFSLVNGFLTLANSWVFSLSVPFMLSYLLDTVLKPPNMAPKLLLFCVKTSRNSASFFGVDIFDALLVFISLNADTESLNGFARIEAVDCCNVLSKFDSSCNVNAFPVLLNALPNAADNDVSDAASPFST